MNFVCLPRQAWPRTGIHCSAPRRGAKNEVRSICPMRKLTGRTGTRRQGDREAKRQGKGGCGGVEQGTRGSKGGRAGKEGRQSRARDRTSSAASAAGPKRFGSASRDGPGAASSAPTERGGFSCCRFGRAGGGRSSRCRPSSIRNRSRARRRLIRDGRCPCS